MSDRPKWERYLPDFSLHELAADLLKACVEIQSAELADRVEKQCLSLLQQENYPIKKDSPSREIE